MRDRAEIDYLVTAPHRAYLVLRGTSRVASDILIVTGEEGEIMAREKIGPGGLLHPESAEQARSQPWFFTGSPFGPRIIGLTWERHARRAHLEGKRDGN